MRCLKCWDEIGGDVAIYTKSCQHVFCERCSGKAFQKELSCPLCDQVLAKDGVAELVMRPDDAHLRKTGAKLFGLEPDKLCQVMQMGLEFWSKQKRNESIQHLQELDQMKSSLEEAERQANKLSKALEDERLKKKSLQSEKDALQRHVSELESRYAEKARAMRKLSELYSELRQVHRRLESDLRGVRGVSDYEDDVGRREIEIQTQPRHTANTRLGRDDHEVNENADKRNEKRETGPSEQISHQGRRSYDAKRGASNSQSQFQGSPSPSNSVPLETLFTLAPTRPSRPFAMNRQRSKETGKARRRRQHSAIASDDGVDGLDDGVKYTGKPRRSIRR